MDNPAVRLDWTAPADQLSLYTDRLKLKMLLRNLVGNALNAAA
jgi:C4-dicarboxylate-specific signal transduction histidine kinase